jgi:di-N-acetylchitobiase
LTVSSSSFSSEPPRPSAACPCDDIQWCNPIQGPPVNPNGELFGFYGHSSRDFNWTYITTVAWASDNEVMCRAHQHGARAVIGARGIDLEVLQDQEARKRWIRAALLQVINTFRDGIVFDYEDPQKAGSIEIETYAKLIQETREVFSAYSPSLQVTTCVPWSPDDIDGRDYPWKDFAAGSDILYVMDYDARSQVFDSCIAGPNAPLPGMIRGIERYFDLGIEPQQLVLGVPWYGYRYACLPGTALDAEYCPIKFAPFRGVNCSDAAGGQQGYASVMKVLHSSDVEATGGLKRDRHTGDPYFNSLENGTVYQYWFDDPMSLRPKYEWARQNGLAGVGPFVFNYLDADNAAAESRGMWSAFDSFFQPGDAAVKN